MHRHTLISSITDFLFPRPLFLIDLHTLITGSYCYQSKTLSLMNYKDPCVRTLIRYLKKNNDSQLAGKIAMKIKMNISQEHIVRPVLVIPVPVSEATYRHRGFNQVQKLGRHLAECISGICIPRSTIQKRATLKQSSLSRSQRKDNIKKAFCVKDTTFSFQLFSTIILLDDVVTTGSTLDELQDCLDLPDTTNIIRVSIAH